MFVLRVNIFSVVTSPGKCNLCVLGEEPHKNKKGMFRSESTRDCSGHSYHHPTPAPAPAAQLLSALLFPPTCVNKYFLEGVIRPGCGSLLSMVSMVPATCHLSYLAEQIFPLAPSSHSGADFHNRWLNKTEHTRPGIWNHTCLVKLTAVYVPGFTALSLSALLGPFVDLVWIMLLHIFIHLTQKGCQGCRDVCAGRCPA